MTLRSLLARVWGRLFGRPEPKRAPLTVQAALLNARDTLVVAQVDDAMRDARKLMAACLGIEVGRLTLHAHDELPGDIEAVFFADVRERVRRVPMSHLLGYRDFYGRRFNVSPDVLDPRGDTETLIEAALSVPFDRVLDLGTGSGCILVTLLAEREGATGVGTDLSQPALRVAKRNASRLGVEARSELVVSDWFGAVKATFDLIVSNPPYIGLDEMAGLAPELDYEPRMALTDEGDGLSCYRIIAKGAHTHLTRGGWLMVEIGPTQGPAVTQMFATAGLQAIEIRTDLNERDRVIMGQKPH